MRLLLVDNLVLPEAGSSARLDLHPHLGLLSLAAAAEADGHPVSIYDPKRQITRGELPVDATLYERAALDLLAYRPEAVGFTTLGASFLFALNVAAALKRREPELPILLGGPHATMLDRQILDRFDAIDVIVRHEADDIFSAVLAGLERRRFAGIPGVSWRCSRRGELAFTPGKPIVEDLDRLPIVTYDHYPVAELGLDLLRIEAGRGCPFACTFCSTATFFQRSFRLKSAARLVKELDRLHQRYGFLDFKLDHDLFTVNRRKVLEFCDEVRGRGYRWRASARVDCVDAELLTKMASAGCVGLYFGIETGSERMQKIAQKRLDLTLVKPTLATAEKLGIETTASFITGYPEEREEDQRDTLDLLGQCFRPSCLPQLHVLAPEPGTAMFGQFAAKLRYDGYSGPYNAAPVSRDDERLIRAHADIFPTYHFYPGAMARADHKFAAEVLDVLRRVGPVVLSYALRAYGGRLSSLIDALRLWAKSKPRTVRTDARLVESYMAAKFGPRHHLTSLFRYALAANAPAPAPAAPPTPQEFDPTRLYRLGAHIRVLAEMHDCERLLQRIHHHPDGLGLLKETDTGRRCDYMIDLGQAPPIAYKIPRGSEAVLTLFERPRHCRAVIAGLNGALKSTVMDSGFFAELAHRGILVPARRASPSSRATARRRRFPQYR